MKEMVGGCCVCADDNGWTDNPLIYCDGDNCEVAVHQGCYGIQEVPEGNWYCAKCTKAATMPAGTKNEETFCCSLCPFSYGALKNTDQNGWAHVICALYIPEVRFGNVHSMEPVILSDIPVEKFQKICYLCQEDRPNDAKKGACMSCNKNNCKRSFHVTCAQRKGLLCEEGAISRNVKYCGYCDNHLKKAINDPAIKVIPACPPVQRLAAKEENAKKNKNNSTPSTVLLTPPPPPPPVPKVTPMLADPIRPTPVNNTLGLGGSSSSASSTPTPPSVAAVVNSIGSVKLDDRPPEKLFAPAFSPPLTTSSRSSVALEPTPPLPSTKITSGPLIPQSAGSSTTSSSSGIMANGSTSQETTVGNHCLQQLQIQSAAASSLSSNNANSSVNDLNGYPGPSQLSSFMHEIPARNTTSVASLLPPGAAEFHLNGSGDEEKTVKAVLTAPLTKAKRMRDAKGDLVDKSVKRPRANARPPAVLGSSSNSSGGTVGKSASMQRLISLVQPVVSEVVTDFQRDRVADRNAAAAERRAAVAQSQPSTSANGTGTNSAPNPPADTILPNITPPVNSTPNGVANTSATSLPGTSTCPEPATNTTIPTPAAPTVNGTATPASSSRLTLPTFMESLLERQWDQGSSLLMANANFDVAQLLSCLFQLKSENLRLEDNLTTLRKRRDHLYTLNSRLNEVNTMDVNESKKRGSLLHQELVLPKQEVPKIEPGTVPANHSSQLFEDVKPPKPSKKNAAHAPAANTLPLTTAAALTTTTTAALVNASTPIQNNRATPSTTGAPLAATPVMTAVTAANELAGLSPDRVSNGAHALLNIYRNMPQMDPSVAAQLSMMGQFQGAVNPTQALFSRILAAQPAMAGLASMMNGGLHAPSQPLPPLPPTSATPNGK
ncbi:CBN-ZFP-1 protein [Caenorhabditis brenneri]|uniref:CBN-ZFP-1 protein n=1 Tax=Caenorhabditis brenneri TaxID=135651 RepID=G0NB66_CAEBE|nr:CBN-ZFP-1 protein [Caenorhabditis brenneri]